MVTKKIALRYLDQIALIKGFQKELALCNYRLNRINYGIAPVYKHKLGEYNRLTERIRLIKKAIKLSQRTLSGLSGMDIKPPYLSVRDKNIWANPLIFDKQKLKRKYLNCVLGIIKKMVEEGKYKFPAKERKNKVKPQIPILTEEFINSMLEDYHNKFANLEQAIKDYKNSEEAIYSHNVFKGIIVPYYSYQFKVVHAYYSKKVEKFTYIEFEYYNNTMPKPMSVKIDLETRKQIFS